METKKTKKYTEHTKPVIYVGENIGNILKQYAVYAKGIPKEQPEIKTLLENCPTLEKLFLPIHQLNDWEQKVKQKGSLEWKRFQMVKAFFKNKG